MYRTSEKLGQCIKYANPAREKGRIHHSYIIQTVRWKSKLEANLCYTITYIINSNTHSSGVSLQQTKEKIYYIPKSTFFAKIREIT